MVAITSADIEDVQEVSGLQQSMLFTSLSDPSGGHYVEQFYMAFRVFDAPSMQEALGELIKRHWALRSLFVWREQDKALLVTLGSLESPLVEVEYAPADSLLEVDRAKGFSLDKVPPIRFTYALSPEGDARCILTFHHAAVDGWSIAILADEILSLYGAITNDLPLPAATADVKPQAPPENAALGLWEPHLQGLPDRVNLGPLVAPQFSTPAYAQHELKISEDQTQQVNHWCKQQRITLSSLVHCVWGLSLAYLNGRDAVVFGSIDSGRRALTNGELAVGMFMSLLPIRVDVTEATTPGEFVRNFQSQYWKILELPPLNPADVASKSAGPPSAALFDSVVIIQNYPQPNSWQEIHLDALEGHEQADVPLVLAVGVDNELTALFRYQVHNLEESAVAALSELFHRLLLAVCTTQGESVEQLFDQLSDKYSIQGVTRDDSAQSFEGQPVRCIDHFVRQVDVQPEAVAYIEEASSPQSADGNVTYLKLSYRAESLRRAFASCGVEAGNIVGLRLPRGTDAVAAMLAVLALDATYLPLDPELPDARLQQIVDDAKPRLVVDAQFLQRHFSSLEGESERSLRRATNQRNTNMCLLYTSGSTGRPKGVMLTHAAVSNRLAWQAERYPAQNSDVFCLRTPVSFVDSVCETFLPLSMGSTTLVIDDATLHSLEHFCVALETNSVTRVLLVPSLLAALLQHLQLTNRELPKLRQCVVSGEALTTALASEFHSVLPHAALLNFYGSTEVTADALFFEVTPPGRPPHRESALVPLGRPIRGLNARVVNADRRSLPVMCVGELAISGVGVASGYFRAEPRAEENFSDGEYRMGDLAHVDSNGLIHFHGRNDRQVQVSGKRVEPAEVERSICEVPGVQGAAVWQEKNRLVGVICTADINNSLALKDQVIAHLRDRLPAHFVPDWLGCLAELPLLSNGKLDYPALKEAAKNNAETPHTETRDSSEPQSHVRILSEIIANLWQELLEIDDLDRSASFFDSGGSSILAMQMLAKLERSLNREIPLAVLVQHPGLDDFAEALCSDGFQQADANILTTREGDAGAHGSILCIHGDAFNLPALMECKRPMYWLSQWQLRMELTRQSRVLPEESVRDMAARYTSYLDRVNLGDELTILAACAAAVVAIEVARLLRGQGLEVNLVLMDLPGSQLKRVGPRARRVRPEATQGLPVERAANGSRSVFARGYRFMRRRLTRSPSFQRYRLVKLNRIAATGIAFTDSQALAYCNHRLNSALVSYQPEPIDCAVKLVWSLHWSNGTASEQDIVLNQRWQKMFPALSSKHLSPAHHHNDLIQGRSAERIAKLLR